MIERIRATTLTLLALSAGALLLLGSAGCGDGGGGDADRSTSGSAASCAAGITWHGRFYETGAVFDRLPHGARRIGRATIPPCHDTDPPAPVGNEPTPSFAVWANPGSPPNRVLVTRRGGRVEVHCRDYRYCVRLMKGPAEAHIRTAKRP